MTIAAAPLARFPLSDTLSDKDMRPRVVLDRVVTVATDEDTQLRSVADDGFVVGVLPGSQLIDRHRGPDGQG